MLFKIIQKSFDQDPINNVDQMLCKLVQNDINQELLDEEKVSSTSQTKKNVVENKLPSSDRWRAGNEYVQRCGRVDALN